jgi:hypothetical protein
MASRSSLHVLVIILSMSCMIGCGGSKSKEPIIIPGKITLNGDPLGEANLSFHPSTSPDKVAFTCSSAADGTFQLMISAETKEIDGSYRVVAKKWVATKAGEKISGDGVDLEQLRMMGQVKNSLPKKYEDPNMTALKADIKVGMPSLNLELSK